LTIQLIQSFFRKKFGNLLHNSKNWDYYALEDVCKVIHRYPTFYGFEYSSEGVPVIKIGNIGKHGEVDTNFLNYDYIPKELSDKFPLTHVKLFDSVLAVIGDGSAGKVGIVFSKNLEGAITTPNLLRISANEKKVDPLFLYYLLASNEGQSLIATLILRTSKKRINTGDFKKLKFPIPPLEIQSEFSHLAIKMKKIIGKRLESYEKIENLRNSIFSKAFKGELIV